MQNKENFPDQSLNELKITNPNSELQTEIKLSTKKNFLPNCHSHPSKRAKFEIERREVCTACAIEFSIRSGVPIRRIQQYERKLLTFGQDDECSDSELPQITYLTGDAAFKQDRVEKFIKRLAEVRKQSNEIQQSIKNEPENTDKVIKAALRELLDMVERNFTQSAIKVHRAQFGDGLSTLTESLDRYIKDALSIKRDILDNIENIVKNMEMGPFNIILSKYGEKIGLVEQNLLQMKK